MQDSIDDIYNNDREVFLEKLQPYTTATITFYFNYNYNPFSISLKFSEFPLRKIHSKNARMKAVY